MQFLYLLLSIYFGRKNSLFFLIFPLALIQGPGAFIDTRTTLIASEFFLLGRNILMDITIFYLILVVIYLRPRANFRLLWETPMKFYLVYILFLIVMTLITYGTKYEAIAVIRLWFYMPLGYFLLVLIFSSASSKAFVQFINIFFIVNAIQSVLYVLNSSTLLPLFDQSFLYLEVESGSATFYRDFNTIPIFSGLLFIYGLTSILLDEHIFNRKAVYSTLATYPFVILFTFTRSVLLSISIQLIIILVILIRYRPTTLLKPYVVALIVGGAIVFVSLKSTFINEFDFFNQRMAGVIEEGKDESNVDIRIQYHLKAWDIMEYENSLIFGDGLNKRLNSKMDDLGALVADSTIPYLLISTGILVFIFFFCLECCSFFFHYENHSII